MTIEEAIQALESAKLFLGTHTRDAIETVLSALRAQQEAEKDEPCYFCKRYNFANARVEVNKYGAYISLAGGNTQFPRNEQFNFCPVCGRVLKHRPPVKEET